MYRNMSSDYVGGSRAVLILMECGDELMCTRIVGDDH